MSLKVYDYRTDIANVLVTPRIRCRFLKMAVGQFNAGHTHDLGHEIVLILQGRAEFEVGRARAVRPPPPCRRPRRCSAAPWSWPRPATTSA